MKEFTELQRTPSLNHVSAQSPRVGGCVGTFFHMFDWNPSKKRCATKRLPAGISTSQQNPLFFFPRHLSESLNTFCQSCCTNPTLELTFSTTVFNLFLLESLTPPNLFGAFRLQKLLTTSLHSIREFSASFFLIVCELSGCEMHRFVCENRET